MVQVWVFSIPIAMCDSILETRLLNNETMARQGDCASCDQDCLDALLSITRPEDGPLTLGTFFERAVGVVRNITGAQAITARIYEPERDNFRLMAHAGLTPEMLDHYTCISGSTPNFTEIKKQKQPLIVAPYRFLQEMGARWMIVIPLVAGDAVPGSFSLLSWRDAPPTEAERERYVLIGKLLGAMLWQVQQADCLQTQAIQQERTRLSGVLHDDIAQLIRSMRWGLEEARLTLDNRQFEKTGEVLENLEALVQQTASYIREEMLGLREQTEPGMGIVPTLKRMLARFERTWGIKTALVARDDLAEQMAFLPLQTEAQLVRIIQEALVNVRRHAEARSVLVRISYAANHLVVTVSDDGKGYRPEDIPQERLGLRIIHERAASVGAKVRIETMVGAGTTLEITIPGCRGVL